MAIGDTLITYPGDGVTTDFPIPFPYNDADTEVVVTREGGAVTYTFANPALITLTSPAVIGIGDSLTISRVTSIDDPVVVFRNGSGTTGGQLNSMVEQLLWAMQEVKDLVLNSMVYTGGIWDALNRRIGNLAEPVDGTDAATKNYADTTIVAGAASAAAAAASAADALASENATTVAAGNAAASELAADASADAAAAAVATIDEPTIVRTDGSRAITGNQQFTSTGAVKAPAGTTAQRPTAVTGHLRFNSTLVQFEGYNGTTWGTIGGGATGGGVDKVFYLNDQSVTEDYTLSATQNAVTAGPITIASGKTVTISTGATWVIV